jgi:hypothetical protein
MLYILLAGLLAAATYYFKDSLLVPQSTADGLPAISS